MTKHKNQRRRSGLLPLITAGLIFTAPISTFARIGSTSTATIFSSIVNSMGGAAAFFAANNFLSANSNSRQAYPKPDFSEMEKWYEVVKYEYGDMAADNKLYFWVKPKTENKPEFRVQFLDRDGALICTVICDNGGFYITGNFDTVPVGTVGKATAITPSEREMEKVASVKVIRIKK